jgi:hypothetical protein
MTLSDDAKARFDAMGLDYDAMLTLAKAAAQQIIDESQDADRPLTGLVYDVWGLYNDGTPKCRFEAPYDNDDLVFTGQFRREGTEGFVVERTVLTPERAHELVHESLNGISPFSDTPDASTDRAASSDA